MSDINYKVRQLNNIGCKTYLVTTERSKEAAIIDPVIQGVDEYLKLLDREGLKLGQVIDTHTHADHISGAATLIDKTGCEYIMHKNAPAACVTVRVTEGLEFKIADTPVKVLHTPGHTKDSITLLFFDRLVTGDTLFLDEGGAGRDDLPGGDAGEHWDSLRKVTSLSDNLMVMPGHDYRGRQPSTLGDQKKRNPHLRHGTKDSFVRYLESLNLGPANWMSEVLKANYACSRDPKAVFIPSDCSACEVQPSTGAATVDVNMITASELKSRLSSGRSPILLDVRNDDELSGEYGKIDGVVHVPVWELSDRVNELDQHKDDEVVVICKGGTRAATGSQILKRSGFKNVFVLKGGMIAWRSESSG